MINKMEEPVKVERKTATVKKKLQFYTHKCKLRSVVKRSDITEKIEECVHKRASFFLRYFCLSRGEVPELSITTMRHCLNTVSKKDPRGARVKGDELGEEMRLFYESKFSSIYPNRLGMIGKSMLKQLIANQMLENILTDVKTHFESRLLKVVFRILSEEDNTSRMTSKSAVKREAARISNAVMRQDFDSVPDEMRDRIRSAIPADNVLKNLR